MCNPFCWLILFSLLIIVVRRKSFLTVGRFVRQSTKNNNTALHAGNSGALVTTNDVYAIVTQNYFYFIKGTKI